MSAARRPARRGAAADRRAPPRRRHRRGHRPADAPPPPGRQRAARTRRGITHAGGRRRRRGGADQQLSGRAPRADARRAEARAAACTTQTRCVVERSSPTCPRSPSDRAPRAAGSPHASRQPAAAPARHVARAGDRRRPPQRLARRPRALWDGHLVGAARRQLRRGHARACRSRSSRRARTGAELRALLALRDRARALLAAEAASSRTPRRSTELRAQLRADYDAYAARYGPINRFTLRRTGRTDPRRPARSGWRAITPPAVRLLRARPVRAARAEPRDLRRRPPRPRRRRRCCRERVVAPRAPRLGADTPQDALAICLDTHGRVELDEIAAAARHRASRTRASSSASSSTTTPPTRGWCPRPSTCPGTCAPSSSRPARAAERRPGARRSTSRALERVLPRGSRRRGDRSRGSAPRGSTPTTHQQFLAELLEDPRVAGRASRRRRSGRSRADSCTRAGHQRVGHQPHARAGDRQGACSSSARSRSPTRSTTADRVRQPDRDRRRAGEGAARCRSASRVVLGGPRPRPAAARRVQPPVQLDRAARLQHRRRAADAPRPRAHVHAARASARRRRADARPSRPSACFTRSAPARPPRW